MNPGGELKTALDLISLAETAIIDAIDSRHGLAEDRARMVLRLLSVFLTKHCRFTAYYEGGDQNNGKKGD
jgi:hypothetical protein